MPPFAELSVVGWELDRSETLRFGHAAVELAEPSVRHADATLFARYRTSQLLSPSAANESRKPFERLLGLG
jgi:hypothetical protein